MFNLTEKFFVVANGGAEAILYLLIVMSIYSVAVMIERVMTLRSLRKDSERMNERIRDILRYKSFDVLDSLKSEDTLHSKALNIVLSDQINPDGIREAFDSFILTNKSIFERGLSALATIGSNAPFIGLLGTVLGIMKAFKDLGLAQAEGSMSSTQAVMSGIAEALVATAVGLFVAIPAVIAFNIFQKKVKYILSSLDALKEFCVVYHYQKKFSVQKKVKDNTGG